MIRRTEGIKFNGISLIVLIITIIVSTIIAGAIIISLSNSNVILKAKESKIKSDFKSLNSELSLWIAQEYIDTLGNFDLSTVNANKNTGEYKNKTLVDIIPSIANTKYVDILQILKGELIYVGGEQTERDALEQIGIKSLFPEVLAYKDRVLVDGGEITDILEFNKNIRFLKDKNIYDNLLLYITSIGGIKKNIVNEFNYVKTVYDFKGIDGIQNTVNSQPKIQNKSIEFDGTNDFLDFTGLPSEHLGTENFTISLWFKEISATNSFPIILASGGFSTEKGFYIRTWASNNEVKIILNDGVNKKECSIGYYVPGEWICITIVIDRNTGYMYPYIEGVLQENKVNDISSYGDMTSSSNLTIGKGSLYYINGALNDIYFFNKALSSNEILELYNATKSNYK